MTIRFNSRPHPPPVAINMALEATFEDGSTLQVLQAGRGTGPERLYYREGTSGKFLPTEGLSFNGLPRTLENLFRAMGRAEPVSRVYVMPAP